MIGNNTMNAWFLFFCALWLAWAHPVAGQELKSIRISLSLGSAQLPLWAARDAGLFAKYGLNAEFLGLQVASRQVQLLLAGGTPPGRPLRNPPPKGGHQGGGITIMMRILHSFLLFVVNSPAI